MDNTPEIENASMGITFHNGDTMTLQQVIHGMAPQVLIRMELQEVDGQEVMRFDLDVTGPDNTADLADVLEGIAEGLRAGEVVTDSRADDTAEEN